MSLGIRFRGLSCPSCGCSGEGPPSVASCLCTACKMPASITVNSIYGMIATGSVFVGNLTNTAVQLFGSGTLTYDPTISLPPCLETPEGVDGCWYGPFSDSSYDSTLWGGRAGSGSVYNTGCDLVNTTTVYTGGYYYGAEAWARFNTQPFNTVSNKQKTGIQLRIYPKLQSIWDGSTGVPTAFPDDCDRPYLEMTATIPAANYAGDNPYKTCLGGNYNTSNSSGNCSARSADLTVPTISKPELCQCWSNTDGLGCQFADDNPISNYVRTELGHGPYTQNGLSYWDYDNSTGPVIKVPVTDGSFSFDEEFYRLPFGAGTGKKVGRSDISGNKTYLLDSCSGSGITGTDTSDPNSVITFDATEGYDCGETSSSGGQVDEGTV